MTDNPYVARDAARGEQPRSMFQRQDATLLEIAWHGRWYVLAGVLICLAGAWIKLERSVPLYDSETRIYLDTYSPRVLEQGLRETYSGDYLQTQVELIRSSGFLSKVVTELQARGFDFDGHGNPVGALRSGLSIRVDSRNIMTFVYRSPSPERSAVLANTIVEVYINEQHRRHRSTAAEALDVLHKEQHRRESELRERYQELVTFRQSQGALFVRQEGSRNIVMDRLAKLSDALTEADMQAIQAQARFQAAQAAASDYASLRHLVMSQGSGGSGGGVAGVELQQLTRAQERLERLEERREQLIFEVAENHPAMDLINRQLAQMHEELADQQTRLRETFLKGLETQAHMARQRRDELQVAFDAQREQAMALNASAAELQMLESEVRRLEQLTDMLASRIKEIDVGEEAGGLRIDVLEVARPAVMPSSPQPARILSSGLMLGVLLGGLVAYARHATDHRLRTPDDVTMALQSQLLGVIPRMPSTGKPSDRASVVIHDSFSGAAEAFRMLRTGIFFGSGRSRLKTVLVTSPTSGDGKSTVVSNLALALSHSHRVVLIDADLRRPNQHTYFGIKQIPGLADVIAAGLPLSQAVVSSSSKNLDLLPCGTIPSHPAELLESDTFRQVLTELQQQYDYVLIDSPPALPVTDASILAGICDGTVLVSRSNKTTYRDLQRAEQTLTSVGANLLGAVFNGLTRSGRLGKYGYGYYYYGYRSDTKPSSTPEPAGADKVTA